MRPRTALTGALALALTASACGGGDASSPTSPKAPDIFGDWEVNFSTTPGQCIGAGSGTLYFTVEPSPVGSSGAVNVVTKWDVVKPFVRDWTLTGNINVESRTVNLNFWLRVLDVGSWLDGTLSADGQSITGTFYDPKPGYRPHFVLGSCAYTASGRRVAG